MKQLSVVLSRKHFPEELDKHSVSNAFWVDSPCIMEKAIIEQIPDFQKTMFISHTGEVYKRVGAHIMNSVSVGKLDKEFRVFTAEEIADKLKNNPEYTETFILNIENQ